MCLSGAQKWDARDNARVFIATLALYLTQRPNEVRKLPATRLTSAPMPPLPLLPPPCGCPHVTPPLLNPCLTQRPNEVSDACSAMNHLAPLAAALCLHAYMGSLVFDLDDDLAVISPPAPSPLPLSPLSAALAVWLPVV